MENVALGDVLEQQISSSGEERCVAARNLALGDV